MWGNASPAVSRWVGWVIPSTTWDPRWCTLVSADAHFVTGQTLAVDGGHFMNL